MNKLDIKIESILFSEMVDPETWERIKHRVKALIFSYQPKNEDGWVSDGRSPDIGKPVIIKSNGVVQNVTYMLDGSEVNDYSSHHWFEPYHFEFDDNMILSVEQVESWIYVELYNQPKNEDELVSVMSKDRFLEISNGIAEITGTSDLNRLFRSIAMHHEIEELFQQLASQKGGE